MSIVAVAGDTSDQVVRGLRGTLMPAVADLDPSRTPAELGGEALRPLLRALGAGDRADDRVEILSRGTRQKVALALALLAEDEPLLFDTPFDGLDAPSRTAFTELLRTSGRSCVVAVWEAEEAEGWADEVRLC